MLTQLFNLFWREYIWCDFDMYSEDDINWLRTRFEDMLNNKAKPFLQRLIDNNHIEEIKSEKKDWPGINDYIKYIAETEDPVKTLVNMLK